MIFLFIHSGSNLLASILLLIQWAHTRCRGLYWFLGATWNWSGGQQSLRAAWLGRYPVCLLHTCLLVLVPQQVALFYGVDGGPGLAALLLVDQALVVGQLGLWLDVKQGGVVSQVLYTLQLILLHLMLKIQRVC